ncbi:MAG: lipoate--protein ligase family protein [Chlorobiaceae bacterium]|nr:lipoate--protein ligase family protein [Chlorobiaceae bacterium]NTV61024.1 lipoate--protein ligase family protein [Chlorobiaceae bacterium]
MEIDRKLMTAFLDGRFQEKYGAGSCLWRFYAWQPFAVTIGYNQDLAGIDREKCLSAGIDVVRRPTGGRAVFHADEFTYSFFMDSPGSNSELYRMVHEVIRLALRGLGIDAGFCRSTLSDAKAAGHAGSVSCFTASARHELQVDGRKLVGSAQRRTRGVLLQHGSLPLSGRHKELSSLIASGAEIVSEEIRKEMERKTVSLEELLGYLPAYSRIAELMQQAAGEISGLVPGSLGPDALSFLLESREFSIQ